MASSQAEKSVEELAQMFNKLNESGLLEKMMEEARKKKEGAKNEKVDEPEKETESEKIDGVLKIESWAEIKGDIVATVQLISTDDFAKVYNAKDKDTFAYNILERKKSDGDMMIVTEKPIISAKKIYESLIDQVKIDLDREEGIISVKTAKSLESAFKNTKTNMIVNGHQSFTIKLVAATDKFPSQICLVKKSDFESFPKIGFVSDLDKDSTNKFCVIDSWFYGCDAAVDPVLVSVKNIKKIPISILSKDADKASDKEVDIAITHVMDIDKNKIATEKHVIVQNKQLSFNKINRIYSEAIENVVKIYVNTIGASLLISGGCSFNGKELVQVIMFKDEVEYGAVHDMGVMDKIMFESLTFVSPKNKKLSKTDYNKIRHFSLNQSYCMQTMLITATQFDTIQNNTNTVNKCACVITLLCVEKNNILEEFVVTHTSWRDNNQLRIIYKFDNQEKSKWVKTYMKCSEFESVQNIDFTLESKPAVFTMILLDGRMEKCLITKDQFEKITLA